MRSVSFVPCCYRVLSLAFRHMILQSHLVADRIHIASHSSGSGTTNNLDFRPLEVVSDQHSPADQLHDPQPVAVFSRHQGSLSLCLQGLQDLAAEDD
ncbi:uncharacterized protein FTOL_03619 [Fusarium torulosum]|uniref:Uncharacterized protein n=1 Tax=Fusarium torulosum TaxID=33205 RepID=A0AAE8SG04_9HYPO|nr:uncharacterized protein FTOL_03619 [Fusarium torulosum]